jgi:hypothetical protein
MMTPSPFNPDKKFVRIIQTHATGLVEFEFAVGEPELFVELLMAQSAFEEFCATHGVTPTQGHLTQSPNTDTQEETPLMQIDLRTVSITPLRQTFDHIAARIGATRRPRATEEATMDVQPNANFHYRPTWDPEHEIFDASRTAITMKDWYALQGSAPVLLRHLHPGARAHAGTAEANFDFVESRGLAEGYDDAARRTRWTFMCRCAMWPGART